MTVPTDDLERQHVSTEAAALPPRPGPNHGVAAEPSAPAEPGAPAEFGSVRRRRAANWGSNATLLTAVTVIISLGNYSYSFLVLHLVGARDFARFSAAQGLLLVIGSGSVAAIPWAMARFIAERPDRRSRREAMHFGMLAATLQGLVFAVVTGSILWSTAGTSVGLVAAASAFVCSVIVVPVGFLQGLDRIRSITALRVLEFIIRYGAGVLILLLVGRSAPAALMGYPIGAVALIAVGFVVCRSGLPPMGGAQTTIRGLARQSLGLGAIQVFLAMLGSLDSVSALAAHLSPLQTASYQSAAVLGRIPLFMSAAIGLAAYVHVVNARTDGEVREKMGQAVKLYSLIAVPFLVACVTVPDSLVHVLIPSRYADATTLLRFTAVSGVAVGWIDVISTAHQARAAFRPAIRILGVAAVAQPIILIVAGRIGGIWSFAPALVTVSLIAAVILTINARAWLVPHVSPRAAALGAAALVAAILLHGFVPAWIGLIAVMAVVSLRALTWEIRPVANPPASPSTFTNLDSSADALTPASQPDPPTPIAPSAPSLRPRVVILGDSYVFGLGVNPEQAFGQLAADSLGAEVVLNLSGVSLTIGDMVTKAEAIRDFAPTLAIIGCGGTESLVHPGPLVRNAIDRWGPRSWRGLTGLEPRPYYSNNARQRLQQQISVIVKAWAKRSIIALTGGQRRIPLAETRDSMDALISLLAEMGVKMVFPTIALMDERRFPGAGKTMADTEAELRAALHGRPDAVLVNVRDVLHHWDDFLKDNLHLAVSGHQRVAALIVGGARGLLAASPSQAETVGVGETSPQLRP